MAIPIDPATALLFPGQGSPLEGEREVVDAHAPELADLAVRLTGADPFERAAESTRFAQPAVYLATIARWLAAGSPRTDLHAGHSLGEVAALVAAGCWSPADGLRIVCARGWLMEEAGSPTDGMLALRCGPERAAAIAREAGVALANDNAPRQQVLSGTGGALARAEEIASEAGVRAMRLPVAGAFHSPAMAAAIEPFEAVLAAIPPAPPRTTVISCGTCEPFADDVAAGLAAALLRPVRWRELVLVLESRGAGSFREVGPGAVLSGLVRRTLTDADAGPLEPAGPGTASPATSDEVAARA